jgi:hypothetical protein
MIINHVKKVRKSEQYLVHLAEGEKGYIGLAITEELIPKLIEIGFEKDLKEGECVLPSPKFGRVSKFNSNGVEEPQRDLPKERCSTPIYWQWKDWGGNYHSEVRYRPYERYPRKFIAPPCTELLIIKKGEEKFVLAGEAIIKGNTDEANIVHNINLMLELFNKVEIFRDNLEKYKPTNIIKLNWELLPSGAMCWEQYQKHLEPVLQRATSGKIPVIRHRLEKIEELKPEFRARGEKGYQGYIVFGFPSQNLYVLESAMYGNATYVFEGDWATLSKLTKAEILAGNLHKHRIIHQQGWEKQIESIIPNK